MLIRVHGLAPREGDAAFAFLVLRLAIPVDRAGLIDLLHHVAPLVPDADRFVAALPDDGEETMRLVAIPWAPPEAGHAFEVQRRLIEGAAVHGIEEAWFFQTGTSLPAIGNDDDGDEEADGGSGDDAERAGEDGSARGDVQTQTTLRATTEDSWGDLDLGGDAGTTLPMHRAKIEEAAGSDEHDVSGAAANVVDDDDDDDNDDNDDDDDDAVWSPGPPPQVAGVRFPVDGYPDILEELDWEDFGIAFKLAGPWAPGERTALTELDDDHDATVRKVRIALRVAARSSELVEPSDLVWLTRLAEPDVRAAAHALLAATGHPMPPAVAFDRRAARALSDAELVRWIGEPHVVGRPALVADAGRRQLAAARPAIVMAAQAVIDHVREGDQNLLEPQARLVEAAVGVLREGPLDGDTIALFDRMLRHANHHVKWELLQAPPRDERLIGGMLHVAGERWDWQETTAKEWLASYAGTSAYEAERKRAPVPVGHRDDDAPDAAAGDDDHDDDGDDGQVN